MPAGAVEGEWDSECEAGVLNDCTSPDAAEKLELVETWCRWRGSDVHVHVALRSHFNARLKVGIVPRYEIEDGGKHGTSFGSDVSKTVEPQGRVNFDVNAGQPEGVLAGTTISKCNPKLYDADLLPLRGS